MSLTIANDVPQPLKIKGLSIAAQVAEVTDTGELDHAHRNHAGALSRIQGHAARRSAAVPTLRLTPEVVSVLDYSKGFGHSDLVKVTDDDLAELSRRDGITGQAFTRRNHFVASEHGHHLSRRAGERSAGERERASRARGPNRQAEHVDVPPLPRPSPCKRGEADTLPHFGPAQEILRRSSACLPAR